MVATIGHDAIYMTSVAPTVMLFVRTLGGRSHCEDEWAEWPDCIAATTILANAVY